ncbi:MAG: hypothetical protein CMJ38_07690 [Phycisphaerae bacterium]|nr:hypothetical protein [Phycisphaerae bacterium]
MTEKSTSEPPQFFIDQIPSIEDALKNQILSFNLPNELEEATLYAVMNGGKRVRPALTLLCAEAVGGQVELAMQAAIAVEFIHCFSLIHDDLPALDDDHLRRGKPTLHIKTNEAMAILAGDNLLTLAFLQLAHSTFDESTKVKMSNELAEATKNMVVGQVYDTLGNLPAALSPIEQVQLVHENKTGALIRCACVFGGMCSAQDKVAVEAIASYGTHIGLMFQIVDDLIDLHGCAEHVGKATRKDSEAGKLTYPSAVGVEESKNIIEHLKSEAERALEPLGASADCLRSFNLWLAQRTR